MLYKKNRTDINQSPCIVCEKLRFYSLDICIVIGKNHKRAIFTIEDRVTGLIWIRGYSWKEVVPITNPALRALLHIKNIIHTITSKNEKKSVFRKKLQRTQIFLFTLLSHTTYGKEVPTRTQINS